MHHRIANRRQDFHLKTAHTLCNQAQTIFAEDLNVKGLTRGMLRNDCVDAAFGQFLSLMAWVLSVGIKPIVTMQQQKWCCAVD
jgi:putative transposase